MWLSPARCACVVGESIPFWDSSTALWLLSRHESFEYFLRFFQRACGDCAFWLRRGRMVLRPHLYCLTSWFTHSRSLYWVLGLCGVRQGYGCVGNSRCDDNSADSSASLAQRCSCGGFFPSFAIFVLVWCFLFFLGILAFIPRLHFWCCLFCSACLFSSSLSPKVASLGRFSCRPPSLVVPVSVFGVSFCGGGALSSSSPPAGCGEGSC